VEIRSLSPSLNGLLRRAFSMFVVRMHPRKRTLLTVHLIFFRHFILQCLRKAMVFLSRRVENKTTYSGRPVIFLMILAHFVFCFPATHKPGRAYSKFLLDLSALVLTPTTASPYPISKIVCKFFSIVLKNIVLKIHKVVKKIKFT
jgi:hypothetical protein